MVKANKFNLFIIFMILFTIGFALYQKVSLYYPKSKIVKLDNSLFEDDLLSDNLKDQFVIEKTKNINSMKTIRKIDWLDNNNLAINYYNDINKLSKLNIDNSKFDSINKDDSLNGYIFNNISPDGSKILYSFINTAYMNKHIIYDINSKDKIKIDKSNFLAWLSDGSGYVGMSDYLYIMNFDTNKSKNLVNVKDLDIELSTYSEYSLNSIHQLSPNVCISKDSSLLYIRFPGKASYSIYAIDLTKENSIDYVVHGNIYDFDLIDKSTLVLAGNLNNVKGIFSYNTDTKKLKLLKKGEIYSFTLSPNKSRITYNLLNSNFKEDLYVASIDKKSLKNNILLFKDTLSNQIKWSKDNKKLAIAEEKSINSREDNGTILHICYLK